MEGIPVAGLRQQRIVADSGGYKIAKGHELPLSSRYGTKVFGCAEFLHKLLPSLFPGLPPPFFL